MRLRHYEGDPRQARIGRRIRRCYRIPVAADRFGIDFLPDDPQRSFRIKDFGLHIAIGEKLGDIADECVMDGGKSGIVQKRVLGVSEGGKSAGCFLFVFCVRAALSAGKATRSCPKDEPDPFLTHILGQDLETLREDVIEIGVQSSGEAFTILYPVRDSVFRPMGITDVDELRSMARLLERRSKTGADVACAVLDLCARGKLAHAVDANDGGVITAIGNKTFLTAGCQIAKRCQGETKAAPDGRTKTLQDDERQEAATEQSGRGCRGGWVIAQDGTPPVRARR